MLISFSDLSQNTPPIADGLEHWLVDILCGSEMDKLGFERRKAKIRLNDFGDFLARSYRFVRFKLVKKRV